MRSSFPMVGAGSAAAAPFEPFPESALDGSIVDRFDAMVRRFPARLAVSDAAQSLSYAELASLVDRIAAAVAAELSERPGPVAIFAANDARYAAAMLGVLAAGRGYVPMDAGYPAQRNRSIASHAGAAAVVTTGDLADQVSGLVPRGVAIIDIDMAAAAATANPQPLQRPGPQHLAHILYTSGSTGVPKGVHQNHRGRLHAILHRTNTLRLCPDDRLALFHSPSTVDGGRVALAALLNGASLHILPPAHWQLSALAQQLRIRGITVCHAVPTLFRHLASELGQDERFDGVRIVHLSGERVDWSDLHLVERCCGAAARLMVALGSTESCASYAQWFVDGRLERAGAALPVGTDVADFRLTIVDRAGRRVAAGAVGEIVISSRHMALGYWRDPELTARMFGVDVADPRLRTFKTGDLGRRRPDGLVEFLGRKDHQIKLRGQRIELGEIEGALRQCAGVRDAAVLVRSKSDGAPRSLAAYVEVRPDSQSRGTTGELASLLAKRLPGYMVPPTMILLDALPRLPNLKIDYQHLAKIDAARMAPATGTIDDPLVHEVAKIFEAVLGAVEATPDDNILSLGGDSLQAMKVAIALERHFDMTIPADIFHSMQSIGDLAGWISQAVRRRPARSRRRR